MSIAVPGLSLSFLQPPADGALDVGGVCPPPQHLCCTPGTCDTSLPSLLSVLDVIAHPRPPSFTLFIGTGIFFKPSRRDDSLVTSWSLPV